MVLIADPAEGLIVTASDLEGAALSLLERLVGAYGYAVARQHEWPMPALPRSYTVAASFDRWAEDQLPAIVVVSPGTTSVPEMHEGAYSSWFGLVVGVYASAATQAETHRLVRLWCGAIRACLAQTPALTDLVSDLHLLAESYNELSVDDRRSIAAGTVAFEARLDDITDANAGPLVALTPPLEPWGRWTTYDVEVERLDDPEEAP